MMPLCTTANNPPSLTWGWEFTSLGAPWVAHRVWPMPTVPGSSLPPWRMPSSTLKRPLDFTTWTPLSLYTATPAES